MAAGVFMLTQPSEYEDKEEARPSETAIDDVRGRDANGDSRIQRSTRHLADGATTHCHTHANSKAEVLGEAVLHSGNREDNERKQEGRHKLCNQGLAPLVGGRLQGECLTIHQGRICECGAYASNNLHTNVHCSVFGGALATTCTDDRYCHCWVEVRTGA